MDQRDEIIRENEVQRQGGMREAFITVRPDGPFQRMKGCGCWVCRLAQLGLKLTNDCQYIARHVSSTFGEVKSQTDCCWR